jgi:hypothetical protein
VAACLVISILFTVLVSCTYLYKVDVHNLVTYLNRAPVIFEWYVVRCAFKNGN